MTLYPSYQERLSLLDTYLLPEERSTLCWLADSPGGVRSRAPRPDDSGLSADGLPIDAEEHWARLLHHLTRLGLAERVGCAEQTSFRYLLTYRGRLEVQWLRTGLPKEGART